MWQFNETDKERAMKGMRMGVVALAMAGLVMGSGAAAASDLDKVIDDVQVELKSAEMTLEVTKDGTVVTSQKVDGVDIRLEWVVPDTWVAPDQSAAAKGWLGTLIDIAISIGKDALSGGSGGSSGGGGNTNTTNTCNVSVTGANVVVIGNLNCGGTQGSGNGSGSGGTPQ